MKKRLIVGILFICLILACGCTKKENNKKDDTPKITIKNYELENLKFDLTSDYVFNEDLSKLNGNEDAKKVFINGDLEKDSGNVIFIYVYREKYDEGIVEYVNSLNKAINKEEEKFVVKGNNKIEELYAREKIIMGIDNITSYVMEKDNFIYRVDIQIPQSKLDNIDNLLSMIYSSLDFK